MPSNAPGGNQILAYRRTNTGSLQLVGSFDTGGRGGRVEGAQVDPLASQESLILDREHDLLIGVNAGSNSVYAFEFDDGTLGRRQVVSSGGELPVSIARSLGLTPATGPIAFLNTPGQVGFTPDGEHLS